MAATTPSPTRGDRPRGEALQPSIYRAYQLPAVLNLSRAYITRLIASGELPSFRVGTARFVAADDVESRIAQQRAAAGH